MRKLFLLSCLTVVLSAADISGKWLGNIEIADASSGSTIVTPVRAEFSQKDHALSGNIGRREEEHAEPIRNGKVEGQRVFFEVVSPETRGSMKFALLLNGDRLEGDMKGTVDTGPLLGKVVLNRQVPPHDKH